jgi:catechol 2,3-dioxygenase-like lactoylglutathione lyase family enzyme
MASVNVRYIVDDVDAAIPFYERLGFEVVMHPAPGFAALQREDLGLLLNQPGAGGAGTAGGDPRPGGWNRFQVEVEDLDAFVADLSAAGARFRGDIVEGRGGRQVLLEDPSGNPVELFEPPDQGSTG